LFFVGKIWEDLATWFKLVCCSTSWKGVTLEIRHVYSPSSVSGHLPCLGWLGGRLVFAMSFPLQASSVRFFVRLPKVQEEFSSEKKHFPYLRSPTKRWLVYLDGCFCFCTLWKDRRGNPNSLFVVRNSRVASDKHQWKARILKWSCLRLSVVGKGEKLN